MEIYTDKEQHKAVIVCNDDELFKLHCGLFYGAENFRKQAEKETEEWQRELDFEIAIDYAEHHDNLAKAWNEIRTQKEEPTLFK